MAQYTDAEKLAYYSGVGYGYGKSNKRMPIKPENQDSFRNGVKKARGSQTSQQSEKPRFSDTDKLKYFGARVGDETLTDGQRKYAAKRFASLSGKK